MINFKKNKLLILFMVLFGLTSIQIMSLDDQPDWAHYATKVTIDGIVKVVDGIDYVVDKAIDPCAKDAETKNDIKTTVYAVPAITILIFILSSIQAEFFKAAFH